jgi:hypothetical protein
MDGIVQRKKPAKMCATASASSSDAAAERAGGKTEWRIAMPSHNAEKQKQSGPPTTPPLEYPGFAIVFPVVPRYFWNSRRPSVICYENSVPCPFVIATHHLPPSVMFRSQSHCVGHPIEKQKKKKKRPILQKGEIDDDHYILVPITPINRQLSQVLGFRDMAVLCFFPQIDWIDRADWPCDNTQPNQPSTTPPRLPITDSSFCSFFLSFNPFLPSAPSPIPSIHHHHHHPLFPPSLNSITTATMLPQQRNKIDISVSRPSPPCATPHHNPLTAPPQLVPNSRRAKALPSIREASIKERHPQEQAQGSPLPLPPCPPLQPR